MIIWINFGKYQEFLKDKYNFVLKDLIRRNITPNKRKIIVELTNEQKARLEIIYAEDIDFYNGLIKNKNSYNIV